MKRKHRLLGYVIALALAAIILLLPYLFPAFKNLSSPTYLRELLISVGPFGYFVFIGLLLLTIPLPIPSTPVVLAGGYVYGTIFGSLLALTAGVIGGSAAFLLIRKFGRPLLERLVDAHHITHFNHIFKKRGTAAAFISFAIPLFPSDGVCLILGLTKMKFRTFLLLFVLAHIPRYLIINSLGSDLYSGFSPKTIAVLMGGAIFILVALFREKLKKAFFKELKELEDEAKTAEIYLLSPKKRPIKDNSKKKLRLKSRIKVKSRK